MLPKRLTAGPTWLLPALEGALLIVLATATPRKLQFEHSLRRRLALATIAIVSLANIISLALLTRELLRHSSPNARELIVSGVLIWLTNVWIFGLWYWETDRGGPVPRAAGHDGAPDFLFPQMTDDRIEPAAWRPQFIDYQYVSLTKCDGVQSDRRDAAFTESERRDGASVAGIACDHRTRRRARGQRLVINHLAVLTFTRVTCESALSNSVAICAETEAIR